jgi:hypothetical protein
MGDRSVQMLSKKGYNLKNLHTSHEEPILTRRQAESRVRYANWDCRSARISERCDHGEATLVHDDLDYDGGNIPPLNRPSSHVRLWMPQFDEDDSRIS